jgi:chromosome segregation ATPase
MNLDPILLTKGVVVMDFLSLNWEKIKKEAVRLSDFAELKKELTKLGNEIQTFDISQHFTPSAKKKVAEFEKAYNQVLAKLNKAQRQFDREFNKAVSRLKKTRVEAEKQVKTVRIKAQQHKSKFKKAADKLRKNVNKKPTARSKKKVTKKKATSKIATSN